jgi:hypothetical protein
MTSDARTSRHFARSLAALLFGLLLAVPAAANAQQTPTPEPVVETETATCEAQVAGWPTFYANVDVAFTVYPGDPNTDYEVRGYAGGGEVAPEGPPNVVVHGSATLVRWRWEGWGWFGHWVEDGQTPVSCRETTYVGI